MRGAFFYVDAGKGHYIPAKALAESFESAGHEAGVFDIYEVLGSVNTRGFVKRDWRFCLRHPRYERIQEGVMDNRLSNFLLKITWSKKKYTGHFKAWFEEYKPDFIVTTHMHGALVLPVICKKLGIKIPILHYQVDIFGTPISGVPCDVYRYYCVSEYGRRDAIKHGQAESTIAMCTYPIRSKIHSYKPLPKSEIRRKLDLDDRFTVLLSFGGEGIGRLDLLEALARRKKYDLQVVIIGGASDTLSAALDEFEAKNPDMKIYRRGFVSNVEEYMNAANIQVGNSGVNAIMESIYMRLPFIVTDLLHVGYNTKFFLRDHPVGWFEKNLARQIEIIESLLSGGGRIPDEVYENVGFRASADELRDLIISDVNDYYGNQT